jgi:signal transduction histidine kinase
MNSGSRSGGPPWSLVLILVSTVATAGAAAQAWRLARSHQATAERVLRDHAGIATWNYSRFASAALSEAVVSALAPVMHFQMHGQRHRGPPPTAQWFVKHYFEETRSAREPSPPIPKYLPRTFMSFMLGADTIGVYGDGVEPGTFDGLVDTLNVHIRKQYQPSWGFGLLTREVQGRSQTVAWTIMPTESALQVPGDTAIYAFLVQPALWLPLLQQTYEQAPILPPELTQGLPNEAVLAVSLRDRRGEKLFRSHADAFSGPVVEQELAPQFGGLRVSAAVRPQVAETLIIGGLPKSRVPYLLGLLALSAALSLVAIRQLRREQELARVRADFVSSVSHELRTPLAQIRLFLETLRLGRVQTPAQVDWSLANIDRETARLSTLVERILTFSRASRNELTLHPIPADVGAAAQDIVDSFAPLAASRNTAITLDAEPHVIACIDRDAFRQILLNLLDNAVKYGDAGQTIAVSVQRVNGCVRTRVEDQGPGVAPDERDVIFRAFHRGREGARSGSGGGGIGLSIVRTLAEQHGGSVSVENAPGGGARFTLDIPPAEVASATRTRPATRRESPETTPAH